MKELLIREAWNQDERRLAKIYEIKIKMKATKLLSENKLKVKLTKFNE